MARWKIVAFMVAVAMAGIILGIFITLAFMRP
jgi:hypothetical protein